MSNENNTWNEWSKLVLGELARLNKSNETLTKEIQEFKVEITEKLAKKSDVEELRKDLSEQKIQTLEAAAKVKEDLVQRITDIKQENSINLSTLEQLHSVQLAEVRTDLRNKAGIWGAIAGMIPVIIAIAVLGIKAFIG